MTATTYDHGRKLRLMQSCMLHINSKMLPQSWLAASENACDGQSGTVWGKKRDLAPNQAVARSDLHAHAVGCAYVGPFMVHSA